MASLLDKTYKRIAFRPGFEPKTAPGQTTVAAITFSLAGTKPGDVCVVFHDGRTTTNTVTVSSTAGAASGQAWDGTATGSRKVGDGTQASTRGRLYRRVLVGDEGSVQVVQSATGGELVGMYVLTGVDPDSPEDLDPVKTAALLTPTSAIDVVTATAGSDPATAGTPYVYAGGDTVGTTPGGLYVLHALAGQASGGVPLIHNFDTLGKVDADPKTGKTPLEVILPAVAFPSNLAVALAAVPLLHPQQPPSPIRWNPFERSAQCVAIGVVWKPALAA